MIVYLFALYNPGTSINLLVSKFWLQFFTAICYIPWNILPIGYIVWCHVKTYSRIKEALYRQQAAEDQK